MKEKEVEEYFNEVLKVIEEQIGNQTTSEDQLLHLGKKLFGNQFRGVYPVDLLPTLKPKQCCIINLDRSGMSGSHWVAVYFEGGTYYVYDSFGRKSSDILSLLSRLKVKDSDYDSEQVISEKNCGQRSIGWLWIVNKLGLKNSLKL